ncbi:MAG: hypothetical protein AUH17_01690 [Actinobacteria bacterium 13_2_20CM_68_14]|nr:MAG: hypothetical protein AUH17_01690 [Actinobacteria bacterium 13_2_20CM_68_14]
MVGLARMTAPKTWSPSLTGLANPSRRVALSGGVNSNWTLSPARIRLKSRIERGSSVKAGVGLPGKRSIPFARWT